MSIFPFIEPAAADVPSLPMYRDVKWDFNADRPVWRNGSPVFVEGFEAVKTWAWCALKTQRAKYPIYTHNYGNEVYALIGKPFAKATKTAEAARYIEECLTQSPYIKGVKNVELEFNEDNLKVSFEIETIYGNGGITGAI